MVEDGGATRSPGARGGSGRQPDLAGGSLCSRFALSPFWKVRLLRRHGAYRCAGDATVADYRNAIANLDPPAERIAIPYAGIDLPGYLRKPAAVERPPVVLIVCGLDSVKEEMNAFEPVFHRRGMATLAFDGPGQGDPKHCRSSRASRRRSVLRSIGLNRRCDVAGRQVAAVGISLGGYYVARAAAFERRLTCAAAVGGPYDLGAVFPTMPLISRQAIQIRSHSPDMSTAAQRARELTLVDSARRIDMPFMTIFGTEDRLIPQQQAERLHREIPHAGKRLLLLEGGNHVCNNMPYAWRPQLGDWIAGHFEWGRGV